MNALSWMLYLASVVESAGVLLFLVFLGLSAGVVANWFVSVGYSNEEEEDVKVRQRFERNTRTCAILAAICGLLLIAIPSRNTIYAIAASEVGETVLNSETGGKAIEALNAWLDKQLLPDDDA